MSTPIDSLDIQISAEGKKASAAINTLVNKVDRLSASLSGVNSRGLATLGAGVNKLSNAMANFSKNTKTADFSRLARNINALGDIKSSSISSAASSITKIASSMKAFENLKVSDSASKLGELAKGISQLGYKSAAQAVTNIPKLATAMNGFMKTLSKAPKVSQNIIDMTNAMARFARTGASGGRAATALSSSLTKAGESFSGFGKSFSIFNKNINKSITPISNIKAALKSFTSQVAGFAAIFAGIKKSVDISSDLTEVQNVVDVAFGKYKKTIEEFSKTSITDFGMSELTAKTMAGRFQSMGVAIGFSQKEMSKISTNLTALAGDMASFYNAEQEAVATSLQSVFTGETEPLRKYGLDLTQATLQQWAMKQGLDANISSMSQAEKTMLRYRYVIANTEAVQGDFARTADSWSNQVRVLRQNFEVLGSIVGGVVINAFKPFVKALNTVMVQVNNFAKIISNSLGKIFGWTYEESGGATNPASDMADSMGDITSATDDATKAQKAYNKQLAKFDELNNYTSSQSTSSSGDNGSSNSESASVSGNNGKWTQGRSIIKSFESEIDSLYELGQTIGTTLKNAMDRIDWDGVYNKAKGFGEGLASFLNGLFSEDKDGKTVLGSLGKTIAGILNTVVYSVFSFSNEFKWYDFGKALKQGIQSFINTSDLATAGYTVGNLAKGIATSVYAVVSDSKTWKSLGKKISDGINGFFKSMKVVDKKTGMNGWETLGANISKTLSGIAVSITTALNDIEWEDVGQSIADFISGIDWKNVIWNFKELLKSLKKAIKETLEGLGVNETLANITANVAVDGWIIKKLSKTKLGNAILKKLGKKLEVPLKTAKLKIKKWTAAFKKGEKTKLLTKVKEAIGVSKDYLSLKDISLKLTCKLAKIPITIPSPAVDDIVRKIETWFTDKVWKPICKKTPWLDENSELGVFQIVVKPVIEIGKAIGNIFKNAWDDTTAMTNGIDVGNDLANGILKGFAAALVYPANLIYELIVQPVKDALGIHSPSTVFEKIAGYCIEGFANGFNIKDKIEELLDGVSDNTVTFVLEAKGKFDETAEKVKDFFSDKKKKVKELIAKAKGKIDDKFKDVSKKWDGFKEGVKTVWAKAKGKAKDTFNNIVEKWDGFKEETKELIAKAKGKVEESFWKAIELWFGVKEGLKNIWIKAKGTVEKTFNNVYDVWSKVKSDTKKLTVKAKGIIERTFNNANEKWERFKNKEATLTVKAREIAKNTFKKIKENWNSISSKTSILTATFNDMFTAPLKKAWNVIAAAINNAVKTINKLPGINIKVKLPTLETGGIYKNGKWKDVKKYAVGGFPNQGQMFIAREAGPELVGNIGNSTAVVNNDQIVASVSDGVAKAVASVIAPMLYNNSQSGDIVVQIDGQTIARAVRKQNADFRKRTGRSMFD